MSWLYNAGSLDLSNESNSSQKRLRFGTLCIIILMFWYSVYAHTRRAFYNIAVITSRPSNQETRKCDPRAPEIRQRYMYSNVDMGANIWLWNKTENGKIWGSFTFRSANIATSFECTWIKINTIHTCTCTYASEKRTTSLSVGMSALAAMSGAVRALIMAPATAWRTLGSARTAVHINKTTFQKYIGK